MQRVMFIAAVMPHSQSGDIFFSVYFMFSHPCDFHSHVKTPAFNAYEELLVENISCERSKVFSMGNKYSGKILPKIC